jgi:hypothetical protein
VVRSPARRASVRPQQADQPLRHPGEAVGGRHLALRLEPFDRARDRRREHDRTERLAQRAHEPVGDPRRQLQPGLVERARPVDPRLDVLERALAGRGVRRAHDVAIDRARPERNAHDVPDAQRHPVRDAIGQRAVEVRGAQVREHVDDEHAQRAGPMSSRREDIRWRFALCGPLSATLPR